MKSSTSFNDSLITMLPYENGSTGSISCVANETRVIAKERVEVPPARREDMWQSTRFLKSRDLDFDIARAFLVLSMVVTHSFEMFYAPGYNRHYTYWVTIGFVFMSGFTNSVRYSGKVFHNPIKYLSRFCKRFLKLAGLFILSNIGILAAFPERFQPLAYLGLPEVIKSMLLGSKQQVFGFDALIPIAMTILLSWFLLIIKNGKWTIWAAIFAVMVLMFAEKFEVVILNYYGPKLLLSGLIGALLGRLVADFNWAIFTEQLQKSHVLVMIIAGLVLYYFSLALFTRIGSKMILSIHIVPSIAILSSAYLASKQTGFRFSTPAHTIGSLLSNHMLFAYLFHILAINAIFSVIEKRSLNFFPALFLSIGILSATITMCRAIEVINKRSALAFRTYSTFFK